MEPNQPSEMSASAAGFTLSAILAIVFNTALTIVKESYPQVNAYMKSLTGHHWITHGLAVVLVFLVFGFLFSRMRSVENMRAKTLTYLLLIAVVLASFGIFGFFIFE